LFFENVAIWAEPVFISGNVTLLTLSYFSCLFIIIPIYGFFFSKPRANPGFDVAIVVLSLALAFFYIWDVVTILVVVGNSGTLAGGVRTFYGLTVFGKLLDLLGWVRNNRHTLRVCSPCGKVLLAVVGIINRKPQGDTKGESA
jgi:hypothetical protein